MKTSFSTSVLMDASLSISEYAAVPITKRYSKVRTETAFKAMEAIKELIQEI